jgi:hypothetical protein
LPILIGGAGSSFMSALASSSLGGGFAVPSYMAELINALLRPSCPRPTTLANMWAAAILANLPFPQSVGEGSGNLPTFMTKSCYGATIVMGKAAALLTTVITDQVEEKIYSALADDDAAAVVDEKVEKP